MLSAMLVHMKGIIMRNFILLLLCACSLQAQESPFVVQDKPVEKKSSKNALKEDVGEHMKGTLQKCASLTRELGELQIQLAQVQQQLFTKVEELLDNRKPFKKASRTQLATTSRVLAHAEQQLGAQLKEVKQLREHLNADDCLKQA